MRVALFLGILILDSEVWRVKGGSELVSSSDSSGVLLSM